MLSTGFAVCGAAGAGWAFVSGQLAAGVTLTASALYLGHNAGFVLSGRWTPRRLRRPAQLTSPDGTTGVTFTYSTWAYYWLVSVLLLAVLGLAAIAVISATTGTGAGLLTAAVVAGIGATLAWFLITVLRLAPGEVTLSPQGVFHRSLTFTHFVPWFAIFAVEAEWVGAPLIAVKAFPSDGTQLRRHTGRFGTQEAQFLPFLAVRTQWLAADPVLVYQALTFYHADPDRRAELGTAAAVDRINRGEFPRS